MGLATDYLMNRRDWVKPLLTDIIKYAEGLGKSCNASIYQNIIDGIGRGNDVRVLERITEMLDKMGEYYFHLMRHKYINEKTNSEISKELGIPLEYVDRDIPKIYECFTRDSTVNYVTHGQEFLDSFKKACECIRRYDFCVDLDISDFNVSVRFADEVSKFGSGRMYYIMNCVAACDMTPMKNAGVSEGTIKKLFIMLEEYKLVPYWVGDMPTGKVTMQIRPPYNILFAVGEFNGTKLDTPDTETISRMVMQGMSQKRIFYTLASVLSFKENIIVREKYFNRKSHKDIAACTGLTTAEVDKISTDILRKLRSRDAQKLMIETMDNLQNESALSSILVEKKNLVEKCHRVNYSDKEKSYLNYIAWLQENKPYGRATEV